MQTAHPDPGNLAEVLIAMAHASKALSRIESELADVQDLLRSSEPLRQFVADPGIRHEGKRRAMQELIGDQCHPALLTYLCYLIDENALAQLDPIARRFFENVSTLRREISGELVSAVPLSPRKVEQIEAETGRLLNKEVTLHPRVDPEILGGIYVRVGDVVLDGTVDRQLEVLRHELLR